MTNQLFGCTEIQSVVRTQKTFKVDEIYVIRLNTQLSTPCCDCAAVCVDDDSDSSSSSEVDEAVDNEANAGSTLPQVVDDHSRSVFIFTCESRIFLMFGLPFTTLQYL